MFSPDLHRVPLNLNDYNDDTAMEAFAAAAKAQDWSDEQINNVRKQVERNPHEPVVNILDGYCREI